jgi:hypothetical protein
MVVMAMTEITVAMPLIKTMSMVETMTMSVASIHSSEPAVGWSH